jgi:hypothetical protein
MNLDLADLVAKAKDGRISAAEKEAVAQTLPSLGTGSQQVLNRQPDRFMGGVAPRDHLAM